MVTGPHLQASVVTFDWKHGTIIAPLEIDSFNKINPSFMKQYATFGLAGLACLASSCISSIGRQTAQVAPSGEYVVKIRNATQDLRLNEVVIDSCEYLAGFVGDPSATVLTHKGNCKFCISRMPSH